MDISTKENKKKKTILEISYDLPPQSIWGQAQHVDTLIHLASLDYNISLCTRSMNKNNPYVTIISTPNADNLLIQSTFLPNESYIDLDGLLSWNYLLSKKIINHYSRNKEIPDLVHNHNWMTFPTAHSVSQFYHAPLVSSIHFLEKQYLLSSKQPTQADFDDIVSIEKDIMSKSDRLIMFGKTHKNFLINEYLAKTDTINKITIIPHGIALEQYAPYHANINQSSIVNIAFAGRIVEEKGINELVETVNQLYNQFPFIRLTVMGEGTLLKQLRKDKSNEYIKFTGFLGKKELLDNLSKSQIFCFPSYSESFGLAVLEAMACGLPIVTTKGPTIEPVLIDEEGLFVDLIRSGSKLSINKRTLYSQLKSLIIDESKREMYSAKSLNASLRYDQKIMYESTNHLFQDLIAKK